MFDITSLTPEKVKRIKSVIAKFPELFPKRSEGEERAYQIVNLFNHVLKNGISDENLELLSGSTEPWMSDFQDVLRDARDSEKNAVGLTYVSFSFMPGVTPEIAVEQCRLTLNGRITGQQRTRIMTYDPST